MAGEVVQHATPVRRILENSTGKERRSCEDTGLLNDCCGHSNESFVKSEWTCNQQLRRDL
jgi:hypothetical protein